MKRAGKPKESTHKDEIPPKPLAVMDRRLHTAAGSNRVILPWHS